MTILQIYLTYRLYFKKYNVELSLKIAGATFAGYTYSINPLKNGSTKKGYSNIWN